MNDLRVGLLVAVVAPVDMKTGAIEMGKTGRQSEALGRGSGNEAVERRDVSSIEGI